MISSNLLEKPDERRTLLKRLFWDSRDFYKLGKAAKIGWFDTFDKKFSQDQYAYLADEEKQEAIELLTTKPLDEVFVNAINSVYQEKARYLNIKVFMGRFYSFDETNGLKRENKTNDVVEKTKGALEETNNRASYFLRAVIELYKEGKWDKVWRGAIWEDILEKVREIGGKYPSPRDLSILKSYRLYFKTGSRRYPTHSVPEEMLPTIEEVLKNSETRTG